MDNIDTTCRLCLGMDSSPVVNIFTKDASGGDYADKILDIFNVEVSDLFVVL